MNRFLSPFRKIFSSHQPIPAGMYHYQAPPDDPRNYRLHLRLEPDGSGILIVNASTILHLNQTAAEYAYHLVHNRAADEVGHRITARYQVSAEQAMNDYRDLADRIQTLINTPDLDPVTFLDFDRQPPNSGHITAPYRLDCAITYRLHPQAQPDAAPTERVKVELSTVDWKKALDRAVQAGIPHIVFTGGEPTLREDLPELIAHAEANNQVSGLLTDGLRLVDKDYLDILLKTGLDHLMIILQEENQASWDAVQNCMVEDLFVAVHVTLTPENISQIPGILERLAQMGVPAISLSATDLSLQESLQAARNKAATLGLELVWNLPVPYSALHPVALETSAAAQAEGAGRAWMYVEPDGDVLPSQEINRVLGNILNDPWEKIWKRN
ncbi:MAG: radical SAM protein [Anaerolineales bacterium]|nr:radical SAM protein [Anaerolineales bacterium]